MDKNAWLMGIATVASFVLLGLLLFFPIPDKNVQVFIFLAGLVCGFFFGASIKQPSTLPSNVLPSPEEPITGPKP